MLFAIGSSLAKVGPLPAVITVIVAVMILAAIGRGLRGAARSLDQIVEAQERVKVGDYAVRVGRPASPLPPIHELAAGFDTMVERLQVDEQQRRTLLADVSHELRTPLTVITGNLEAILDGVYPADEAHLAPILEETRVLSRLIDDLRTIALSEAGTLTLHPEPTDPDVLIGDVVRSFQPVAASAGVTLATDVDGDLPILEIDPLRIREVLSNLVANALRHTPAGGTVTIGGWASAADEAHARRGIGDAHGQRHGSGHRSGAPAARVRSVRQGRGVPWFRPRPGHRPRARGGPRRMDRGAVPARWRGDVPREAA